jgi:ribosomal protein L11 methyltransferase
VVVRALFPIAMSLRPLCELLSAACSPRALKVTALKDSEWQAAARRQPVPHLIGERLWLSSAQHRDADEPGLIHVRLHMGMAFGTGEHPTTAMCLEWLEANVRPGMRVIDYGCGSGVLAIAALALGATEAWAIDDDPQALTATAENGQLNGVSERLRIGAPSDVALPSAEVVIANIVADPLVQLAPAFMRCLMPGGALVLSGILVQQRDAVQAAYAPYCGTWTSAERDGWLRLDAARHA